MGSFYYWKARLHTYHWGVNTRHFRYSEKLQSKVSKREVWREVINAFKKPELSGYWLPKFTNIGSGFLKLQKIK